MVTDYEQGPTGDPTENPPNFTKLAGRKRKWTADRANFPLEQVAVAMVESADGAPRSAGCSVASHIQKQPFGRASTVSAVIE
jgi:hypothetical protein